MPRPTDAQVAAVKAITEIENLPRCPICHDKISKGAKRWQVIMGVDNMPVSVPIHLECRPNIGMLDPDIYIIPKAAVEPTRHWTDNPALWAAGA